MLLTAATQRDLVVIDFMVNTTIYKLSVNSVNGSHCALEPSFVSENVAALCERNSGSIFLNDIRAGKMCGNFSPGKDLNHSRSHKTYEFKIYFFLLLIHIFS